MNFQPCYVRFKVAEKNYHAGNTQTSSERLIFQYEKNKTKE